MPRWRDTRAGFYKPIIAANVNEMMTRMRRGGEAEQAVRALAAVGWHLHTGVLDKAGATPNEFGIGTYAHPLFVRTAPGMDPRQRPQERG